MANCIVITASSSPTSTSISTITNNQTEPTNNNTPSSSSSLANTTNSVNIVTSIHTSPKADENFHNSNLNFVSSDVLNENCLNLDSLNHTSNITKFSLNSTNPSVFTNKTNLNNTSDNIDNNNTINLQHCCCAVDKIKIRKDLQKWSKKILLFAGLERVAIELMGVKLWHKVFAPFYCLQTNEPCDWMPKEICFFCNKKISQTEFNSTNYLNGQTNKLISNHLFHSKNESNQLNSSLISNNMAGKNSASLSEEVNLKNEPFQHLEDCHLKNFSSLLESKVLPCSCLLAEDTSADVDSASTKSETPSFGSNAHSSPAAMTIAESQFTSLASLLIYKPNKTLSNENLPSNSSLDQPLDLSTHTRNKMDNALNLNYSLITGNKNVINVKPKKTRSEGTWKRTYTEEELEKALDDIQSGKLGTRRAAALYRIPRSTLRNKVYKLTQEKNSIDKNAKNLCTNSNNSPVKKIIDLKSSNLILNNNFDNNSSDLIKQSQKIKPTQLDNEIKVNNALKELLVHQKNNEISNNQPINTNNTISDTANESINTSNLHQNIQQIWQQIQQQQVINSLAMRTGTNNQLNNLLNETLVYQILNQQPTLDFNSTYLPLIAQFLLNLQINKQQGENNNQANVLKEETSSSPNHLYEEEKCTTLNKMQDKSFIESNLNEENLEENIQSDLSSISNSPSTLNIVSCNTKTTTSNENEVLNKNENSSDKKLNVLSQSEDSDADMFAFDDTSNSQQAKNEKDLVQKTINSLSSNLCSLNENVNSNLQQNNQLLLNNFANLTTLNNFTNSLNLSPLSLAAGLSNLSNLNSLANINTTNTSNNANILKNKPLKMKANTSLNDDLNQFIPINLLNVGIPSVNKPNASNASNENNSSDRKRPKRGRYRNYNRDDLARAVRAVQRGEMSVHRAGTLFGVPHSTLEYKVKERHLLRPKKRLQKQNNNNSLTNFNTSNLQRINLDINLDDQSAKNVNKNENLLIPPSLINLDNRTNNNETIKSEKLKNVLINEPVFDNYASDNKSSDKVPTLAPLLKNAFFSTIKSNDEEVNLASNNFTASNMIRRLQETVRSNNEDLNPSTCFASEINNFNLNNNVGLIGNLIKASLDEHLKNQVSIDCNNNNVLENDDENKNKILNEEFNFTKTNSDKTCDIN